MASNLIITAVAAAAASTRSFTCPVAVVGECFVSSIATRTTNSSSISVSSQHNKHFLNINSMTHSCTCACLRWRCCKWSQCLSMDISNLTCAYCKRLTACVAQLMLILDKIGTNHLKQLRFAVQWTMLWWIKHLI